MQGKIKNVKTGAITETRFRVDDTIDVPFIQSKEYEFLYRDGDTFVVMDTETYDQVPIDADIVGDAAQYLRPNERVTVQECEGAFVSFEVPFVVELEVTDTPPGIKGATATNQLKEATLETGLKVKVPPFIEPGEKIRIDTRTGAYVERAK